MIRACTPLLLSALSLAACTSLQESSPEEAAAGQDKAEVCELPAAAALPAERSSERERLLADLLFEGLQALDADRLLTPADDSAHGRFKRVLAYDPDNEIALQGLNDIVRRYAELAEQAALRGLFDQAEIYLERARFVNAEHAAIVDAESVLARERESGDLFFQLDASAVQDQSDTVLARLLEIAEQAREHQAFVLILAPSDVQARWIYNTMREAVDGYRLRGNIELANRYGIRLRMP